MVSKCRSVRASTRLLLTLLSFTALLGVGEAGGASLTASWVDNSNGVATTRLERRLATNMVFATIADVPPGVTQYVDASVSPGTGYCYRVLAHNADGVSPYSEEVCATSSAQGPQLSIIVAQAGNGSGTVASTPAGILCGTTCSATYLAGTSVTLTAIPDIGAKFAGWSGAGCAGTAPCTIAGNAQVTVTATFIAGTEICCEDFNGGGQADILWRDVSGAVALWVMNGTKLGAAGIVGTASSDWVIIGAGDFNGDGRADILWRNSAGNLGIWLMNGASIIGTGIPGTVTPDWTVEGVGDFNNDGKADILWRHSSGAVAIWLMNGTSVGTSGGIGSVTPDWTISGVGDFNDDGRADILWRHNSGTVAVTLMNGLSVVGSGIPGSPGTDWAIAGVGDFNGDGRSDILWRHNSGTVAVWLMNGTTVAGSGISGTASADWTFVGAGTFNADTKDDILWRNSAGDFSIWLMNGPGIASISAPLAGTTSNWRVQ
jgi:hypothetical protein